MKKILLTSLATALCVVTTSYASAAEYTLKISMAVGEKDPMYAGGMRMKEKVEERTNGDVTIELYPGGQLGPVEEIQEQAMYGDNVAIITDSGRLAVFSKEIGVIGVAYAAKDYEEMKKIIETDVFKGWENNLRKEGLRILSFNWFQGSRSFMTNKEVKTPEDLNGLLIRTPGATVWSESVRALGATPTALPWAETYPAMQQGTVDGFEAQIPATYASSLQETIKYVAETEHFQLMTALVTSEDWMNSLPEEYQTILLEEAQAAGAYASDLTNQQITEFKQIMIDDYGIAFNKVDKQPFIDRARPVMEKLGYEKEYQAIQDSLNN